uniref:uncharacterized protein LOC101310791 n=1 Tax=Fragaria vesca subsp. vesca TaxID=101020 RepID=UPI0005CA0D7C|nr:PREDICTED: uncharacterized protein LOC101310791 [Fragaria vesca subsp. vesca]
MRMLAYGVGADAVDDYIRIGESTAIEALRRIFGYGIHFFGLPGSHNDINVLEHSPLFVDLREGRAPPVNFRVNDHDYKMGYYLADGIYPSWSTFVKTIPCPQGEKAKNFAKAQEGCRKDVERAFGVLQTRFAIVKGPARFWDRETLQKIMKACVIMHNMIIEDEHAERIADLQPMIMKFLQGSVLNRMSNLKIC